MTTATAPIFRSFTAEQSSAIANIEIDGTAVEIIFQSNTDRAYGFNASDAFATHLAEVISSPDLLGLSLGRLINDARRNGDLEQIPQPEGL
jgi:hypothetical protein